MIGSLAVNFIELPRCWARVFINQILSPGDSKINPNGEQITAFIGLEHIEKNTGYLIGQGTSADIKSTKSVFHEGDLLYGKLRPYLNKVYVAQFDGVCSTDILVFPRSSHLSNKFIAYRLLSFDFVSFANKRASGVQHPRVSWKDIGQFSISLPPLPEQHRIVAKIEELFTRLDAGVEALKKIKTQVKRYRQAVLKYAFEGKLTAEWREKHKDELEPASVLLERIKEERKKALGKKYKESPLVDTTDLAPLPDGWAWCMIEDIGSSDKYAIVDGPFGSSLKVSDYTDDGDIPVISISNIDEGFDRSKLRFITRNKFETIKRSAVMAGDILVAKIGSSYGKCGYYPEWMPTGMIPANLLKVTVSNKINKSYIYNYLKSHLFKKELDVIVKSTAQPAFNVSAFRALYLPLPPFSEQNNIFEEIESRFSITSNIEKIIDQSLKQTNRLRQSILKRAFVGKLVPQDPSDEPAEKLLERIKAERESRGTAGKMRKKGKKKKDSAHGGHK